ncbi:MAG: SDR family oxidoreductase [Liquorilactobacillus nagelii]|jgi:short-subunit dehydrogenase|uniref:Short-chain dehydrogenase n=1 Tax=Liquorilactobacillus nagelii TaxID=82688 RepID=A0A3Q8CCW2_9LACO|nr:SDR family oxidoreductase [Liquorilactobacillus nagelii]AUJ32399.1 short-chain dehydrogenase [Liquorilactobacillus nagelii]KRL40034.1 Short chain dehydrogenase [Liquorilactobacillus nagelii DSM 13675]MCC7615583.1 NAD(P)-dependent oxidoreductase [Liquorilactobacillus nagelii]MCI1634417.1 SDR family oxidoreductase [Liquorilactobacillus nagelii]MCI1920329.1 SDR family oxidoreductase [Liquorilactobacillus nagelii]
MKGYSQLKDLRNRIAVVTGASSGLGEQVAYQLAQKGAIVVVCARRLERLKQVSQRCQQLSGRLALPLQLDVSDPAAVEAAVDQIETDLGPIAILVNDAGFGLMENFLDFEMAVTEKMFRVNVLGLMYLTRFVGLKMAERQVGAIINVASIAAKIATPKSAVYAATKAAVLAFSNALRLELKPLGISVLTVNPGPIKTEFFSIADRGGHYLDKVDWLSLNPQEVAEKIVRAIGTSRRELNLPYLFEAAYHFYNLFPRVGDCLAGGLFNKK